VEALEENCIENIFRNAMKRQRILPQPFSQLHPLAIHEAQKSALHHREWLGSVNTDTDLNPVNSNP
jgi:hypothetical protein